MSEAKRPEPMYPVDIEGAPEIILGGKPWKVPKLAHGQNKHVVPALASIMPKLIHSLAATGKRNFDDIAAADMVHVIGALDEAAYEAIGAAVFWSLKRAHPQLGAGEFEAMPITPLELLAALTTVMVQTGFFKPAEAGEKPAGETTAAAPSTGTE